MRGMFAQKPQCAEHVDGGKPNKPAPIGVYEIGYTPSNGMMYDVLNTALHPKTSCWWLEHIDLDKLSSFTNLKFWDYNDKNAILG